MSKDAGGGPGSGLAHRDLWVRYKEQGDEEAREQLILEYAYLVEIISGRMAMGLPAHVQMDDLESYGILGLLDAVEKFEYSRGIKFETYAVTRIRGAMLDGLRQLDWMPASLRRKGRDLDESWRHLSQKLGRTPTEKELARHLDLSEEEFTLLLNQTSLATPLSLEGFWSQTDKYEGELRTADYLADPEAPDPLAEAEFSDMADVLAEAIDWLPEREKLVVSLYYYDGLTLKEVAEILELSAARISQLHARAIHRLRSHLSGRREMFV